MENISSGQDMFGHQDKSSKNQAKKIMEITKTKTKFEGSIERRPTECQLAIN